MNDNKTISALNELIEINNARVEGYFTALKETEESDLKLLFSNLINTSEKCNNELMDEVETLDGTPSQGTNIFGKFFRQWMEVKAAIRERDHATILFSCEYSEEMAVVTYDKVINNHRENFNSQHLNKITEQRYLLKRDHDHIKSLRDALALKK